ncbi:MAG: hypothetical protein ACTSQD_01040 [Promethearchaeota archaeon]
MEEQGLKFFKLDYSGSFKEINTDSPLDLFTLVDILAIYIPMQKRMYIWIGKWATQSLRNYIPQIRTRFSEKLPELKILRNITIESGSEPSDFFQPFKFTWETLNSHIDEQETKLKPIINEIDSLKEQIVKLTNLEEFEEAIILSKEIINLSKEIEDKALENEQKDNIKDLRRRGKLKISKDKVEEETEKIKKNFEDLIDTHKAEDIVKAHQMIDEYKIKYENFIDLSVISSASDLLLEEDKVWKKFTTDQNKAIRDLKTLANKIKKYIEKNDLEEAETILIKARELLLLVSGDDLKHEWNEIESQVLENKIKTSTIEEIEKSILDSSKLSEELQFKDAISRIESTIELIQDKEILEYNNKLKNKMEEIIAKQAEFENRMDKINLLKQEVKENRENGRLNAVIIQCEEIVKTAELIKKQDIVLDYSQILEETKNELEEERKIKKEKQEALIEKAKALGEVIQTEDNVLPLIEEFSVEDILSELSDDTNEMLNQVSTLLNEHRVEVKQEIKNKALLTSASGEVLELDQNIEVKKNEMDEKVAEFNVQSGIVNPFEDAIEEAVLTDLIPYNFEITKIQLNGEPVKELPDKTLSENGIELNWQFKNIPPQENVEINYDLRRRVSRTIIFILNGQLKIIKTHSKLNMLELEGLYEAKLPFTNSYEGQLEGVIVEDIIPLYYLNFIKEPTHILPAKTTTSEHGELVKWNVGTMEIETLNYQYRLLELYRYEEIKININHLNKEGLDSLERGDLSNSLAIYEKLINQLEEYNK